MSWRGRLVLWLILIVVFVGFYAIFNHTPGPSTTAQSDAAFDRNIFIFVPGAFIAIFGFFTWRARKGAALANAGLVLANQGRLSEGLVKIDAARPYFVRGPQIPYFAGSVRLALWQLSVAEVELRKALKATALMNVKHLAVPKLALTLALLGRENATRNFLGDAEKLNVAASPDSLVATAILECRAARWESAARTLARNELRNLGGPTRGLADALRAWCSEQLTGQPQPFDLVAVLGEASIEGVRGSWPELASFLERAPRSAP